MNTKAVEIRRRLERLFERNERTDYLRRAREEHELFRDGGPTYLEYVAGERQFNEHEWLMLRVVDLGDALTGLRSFVAQAVPFLEEAWHACFHGEKEQLLSAEERGMGFLLAQFRQVAAEQPAIPPGLVTWQEASKRTEAAVAWAHKLLGSPNELAPELQEWMSPGETCADGLRRAQAEVDRLRDRLQAKDGWTGLRVRTKSGWLRDAGDKEWRVEGTALGPPIFVEQEWLPVKWDDREDPDFFKVGGIERL